MADSKNGLSRRRFVETAAATATVTGCKTSGSSLFEGMGDNEIVKVAIHPAIGVARVGNSQLDGVTYDYTDPTDTGSYVGPEVIDPPYSQTWVVRDSTGRLKRQVARFRIYGYNRAGKVVRELKHGEHGVAIKWRVKLANKKPFWYRFTTALDIPECKAENTGVVRRNADVKSRAALVNDPDPCEISGRNKKRDSSRANSPYLFANGSRAGFFDIPVPLGEVQTDDKGRLLVFGGVGKSGHLPESKNRKYPVFNPRDPDTFNNADGWYDDIADGPVTAQVQINGVELDQRDVDSAWVIVGPPNYAPDVIGWRTMHDLLVETFTEKGLMSPPRSTSFKYDVLPFVKRLSNLQWVNKGLSDKFSVAGEEFKDKRNGEEFDFSDPELLEALASGLDEHRDLRLRIAKKFGLDSNAGNWREERENWPNHYGDAFGSYDDSSRVNLKMSRIRRMHFRNWLDGRVSDAKLRASELGMPSGLESLAVAEQPQMLDRAALHFCLADAFHPGCEITWPMRHESLFEKQMHYADGSPRFRINAQWDTDYHDFGPSLTAKMVDDRNDDPSSNPLKRPQGPGDLTKWMAIPWQGDTVFCRSGYDPEYNPYLPTFWPARVPNNVLESGDYVVVRDKGLPLEVRAEAFHRRESWVRDLKGGAADQIEQVVERIDLLKSVVWTGESIPGTRRDPDGILRLPDTAFIAVSRLKNLKEVPYRMGEGAEPGGRRPQTDYEKAGFENKEQWEEFYSVRFGRKPPTRGR